MTSPARERVCHSRPRGTDVVLLPPVERQEVWAAGVTDLRSNTAWMDKSDFSVTASARVYEAPRPEISFKAEEIGGPQTAHRLPNGNTNEFGRQPTGGRRVLCW